MVSPSQSNGTFTNIWISGYEVSGTIYTDIITLKSSAGLTSAFVNLYVVTSITNANWMFNNGQFISMWAGGILGLGPASSLVT